MNISYKTVRTSANATIIEKKSTFICSIKNVDNEEQAIEFVREVRGKNREARHNPYAYTTGFSNETRRNSDDGEPSGTAGMPILEAIIRNDLKNTAAVVTRYFGGILLGTSGLARAYSASTVAGIEAAGIVEMILCSKLEIKLEYRHIEKVFAYAESLGCEIGDKTFGEFCIVEIIVPSDIIIEFERHICDITSSDAIFKQVCSEYRRFKKRGYEND